MNDVKFWIINKRDGSGLDTDPVRFATMVQGGLNPDDYFLIKDEETARRKSAIIQFAEAVRAKIVDNDHDRMMRLNIAQAAGVALDGTPAF